MYNHLLYILFWAINTLVIKFAYLLFPYAVVLGTHRLFPTEAAIHAGFWITFIIWTFWDLAIARKISLDKPVKASLFFFFVNILAVWVVARFSLLSGMGIVNFWVAISLGGIISILHNLAKKAVT